MHRKGNRYDFIWTSMEYNERTKGDYLRPYKQTWFQSPYNHQFKTQQLHNHEYAWEAVYYFKLYGRQRCKIYSINVLSGSSYTKLLPPGQEAKIPSLGEGILREGLPLTWRTVWLAREPRTASHLQVLSTMTTGVLHWTRHFHLSSGVELRPSSLESKHFAN